MGLCLLLLACGGGGSSSSNGGTTNLSLPASAASLNDSNVALIEVRQSAYAATSNVNIPYVSVTVCQPGAALGSSGCLTIHDVLVDTGSTGLRLFANQVSALALPGQTVGSSSSVFECANFLNANTWGGIKLADIAIGGERAPSVPIQVIDASDAGAAAKCADAPLMSPSTLSANGILGVGVFSNDGQNYFDCTTPGTGCQAIFPSRSGQVQNPVGLFAIQSGNSVANNNGVVLQLPSLRPSGVAGYAPGFLIFGINTQSNNQLGTANVVPLNASGYFTTTYRGQAMGNSFIDSGSNGLYFADPSPTVLSGACATTSTDFYCPASTVSLNAAIALASGSATVDFNIANADNRGSNYALDDLGGVMPSGVFDWGLPFFFGRSVYTAIEGKVVSNGGSRLRGPFNAFTN